MFLFDQIFFFKVKNTFLKKDIFKFEFDCCAIYLLMAMIPSECNIAPPPAMQEASPVLHAGGERIHAGGDGANDEPDPDSRVRVLKHGPDNVQNIRVSVRSPKSSSRNLRAFENPRKGKSFSYPGERTRRRTFPAVLLFWFAATSDKKSCKWEAEKAPSRASAAGGYTNHLRATASSFFFFWGGGHLRGTPKHQAKNVAV